MRYSRYTWAFAAAVIVLTLAALASFRAISALALGAPADTRLSWPGDTLSATTASLAVAPSYAQLDAADESWRKENAKQYSLSELRARGDGRRTPRQALQDRVYAHTRRGDRASAIRELERWVASHRSDGDALLWLARLLNDAGRSKESVQRYRQALALEGRR